MQIANTIINKARICNLDKDIVIPDIDAGTMEIEGGKAESNLIKHSIYDVYEFERSHE